MDTPKIEYVKLWMQQSQLFWSRLQTAALLHSGVLVGWYKLPYSECVMKRGLLLLGVFLSVFLITIMVRDMQYMEKFERLAEPEFPTGKSFPVGRACACIIVGTFPLIELAILLV